MTARTCPSSFLDDFSTLAGFYEFGNLVRPRSFPRIVSRPDVRINPTNPAYYKYKGKICGHGWFPFILRLASGDLICLFTESSAHVYCPGGRTVLARSRDGGRTWSRPQVLFYKKDWINHAGYGHVQSSDGRIWVSIRSQFYDTKKGAANDPRAWKHETTILVSDDNGHTWRKIASARAVTKTVAGQTIPRPAIEMSNGRILWTGSSADERGDSFRATFLHTEKNGKLVFEKREHPELGPTADEWSVVETRTPGVLVCMMRQQQHSQFFATARSYDFGETWTPWRESNVYMGPFPTRPWLRRADDGTLLFTFGQRWIGRTFVVASHDDGETWDIPRRQTILHSPRDYHKVWDSHYTDIARAEGNTWLAVDYVASPRRPSQKGLYGTFIDARFFRDLRQGLSLASVGTPVRSSTAGYWSFDELDGAFAHDPIGGNFAEIHNASRVPGRFGNALRFNGKKSFAMVYDDATLRVPKYFTLEAWILVKNPKRDQAVLSKAPRYALTIREGKLALEIGEAVMVSEHGVIPANRWVHVAVSFGMRRSYSRATFYIDGKEDSWVQPAYGTRSARPLTFTDAMNQSDTFIVGGPLFQEFGHKNKSADNLVIGMDNNLRTRPFRGLIDEIAIHAGDTDPRRLRESVRRRFLPSGSVSSLPIALPLGERWRAFSARVTAPARTSVSFSIEDDKGNTLLPKVADGTDLKDLLAQRIVLRAKLATRDPGQTPILHDWSVSCSGPTAPAVHQAPFPLESAPLARIGAKPRSGVVL
ncbi:MAG: exo-alpha-sialidase [Planctomycetota bacterium]